MHKDLVKKSFDIGASNYEYISFFESRGLHFINLNEIELVCRLLPHANSSLKEMRVLDLGAGTGRFMKQLSDKGATVVGIDISTNMLKIAKHNVKESNALFILGDIARLPLQDKSFDAAICMRALKYVPHYEDVLKEVQRVLKGNAVFIVEIESIYTYACIPCLLAKFFPHVQSMWRLVRLFSPMAFSRVLRRHNFSRIKLEDESRRLPLILYAKANRKCLVSLLVKLDTFLSRLLPAKIFARKLIFVCKKETG